MIQNKLVNLIKSTENLSDINELFSKKGTIYTFLNPVSYLEANKHKAIFTEFNGIFADGSLLVKAIGWLYKEKVTRVSFDMTSLAPQLLSFAEKNGKSIYIVASKQEEVEKAIYIFKERYPKLLVAGYRNGYFNSEEETTEGIKNIITCNPDFIIVGMGIVMQEKFLVRVHKSGFEGIGFTCGGFIHQTSKNEIDYYPEWINKYNLRFIYRMYKEKHTRKRYLQAGILFPIRFIYERFSNK